MVVAAETVEMDSGALARVEALFLEQIHQGLHPGAALAVYRHGQPVLDLYGGVADTRSGKPSSRDTMFVLFSSTKPLAAACLYILWERGKLGWDDPVAKHWPGFAQNGKAEVTVRQVLTHQSGFPETPEELTWDRWRDWSAVVRAMERATPSVTPSRTVDIHTFGHGGAGTSVGWADADSGLAVAIITNGFRANHSNNRRLAALSQAVRDACR